MDNLPTRLASNSRATKDIDLVVDEAGEEDLATILGDALSGSYQGFSFRDKGDQVGGRLAREPNGSLPDNPVGSNSRI